MSKSPKFKICGNFPLESKWNPATWPETEVPPDAKINKGTLKNKYFLEQEHIVDLKFERRRLEAYYVEHLYVERQIERRAWQVFGGSTGLRARQSQQNGFRSKWLRGTGAEQYIAASDRATVSQSNEIEETYYHRQASLSRQRHGHDQMALNMKHVNATRRPTTITVDIDLTQTASSSKRKRLKPRVGGSNGESEIIVISDDDDLDSTFSSEKRLPSLRDLPHGIVVSSPIPLHSKGKKRCWESVIELGSDEGCQELPVKKTRKSL